MGKKKRVDERDSGWRQGEGLGGLRSSQGDTWSKRG